MLNVKIPCQRGIFLLYYKYMKGEPIMEILFLLFFWFMLS